MSSLVLQFLKVYHFKNKQGSCINFKIMTDIIQNMIHILVLKISYNSEYYLQYVNNPEYRRAIATMIIIRIEILLKINF